MDRIGRFSTSNSPEKRFRKRCGIDKNPRPASDQECRDAIERGIQGLEKNNLSVRELKDQANIVSNWIKKYEFCFSPEAKDNLKNLWNNVHYKFLDYKYLKYYNSRTKNAKDAIAAYLDDARKQIEAIWQKK